MAGVSSEDAHQFGLLLRDLQQYLDSGGDANNYFVANPPSNTRFDIVVNYITSRGDQLGAYTRIQLSLLVAYNSFLLTNEYRVFYQEDSTYVTSPARDQRRPQLPFPGSQVHWINQTPVNSPYASPAHSVSSESIEEEMATFQNCSFYHVKVSSVNYLPNSTIVAADAPAVIAELRALRADKIVRSITQGDRPLLSLTGSNKTRQYENFIKIFNTILLDFSSLFDGLIDLTFDQHASIQHLQTAITAAGNAAAVSRDGAGGADMVDNVNVFSFSAGANRKLYTILTLVTKEHAHEIVSRVDDNDGRQALFSLRMDALKQTDSQVNALQAVILSSKLLASKHPSAFLDKLKRNCEELDSLLRFQDSSSQFGPSQTKSAILSALPDEYKTFRIARDQQDTRSQSVDALMTSIVNYYTSYIEKSSVESASAASSSGEKQTKMTKSQKRRAAKAGKAKANADSGKSDTSTKSKSERAKEDARATDTSQPPTNDCILCRELPQAMQPKNLKHWFKDCPTIKSHREACNKATASEGSNADNTRSSRSVGRSVSYEIPDVSHL
jgi:hypothetical protein